MTLQIARFVRKPFGIDAVRVTEENMEEVATWCDGEIRKTSPKNSTPGDGGIRTYIKVRVARPMNERQTQAFVGDWILYASGYKVYSDAAFRANFVRHREEACGNTKYTADHQPCVLGVGHRSHSAKVGCRSLEDYRLVGVDARPAGTSYDPDKVDPIRDPEEQGLPA